jgi:hypothetical protein
MTHTEGDITIVSRDGVKVARRPWWQPIVRVLLGREAANYITERRLAAEFARIRRAHRRGP